MFTNARMWLSATLFAVMSFAMLAAAQPAQALQRQQQCFPETGFCVEGRLLEFWLQSGGLAVYGYPIGPAQNETNRDTGKAYLTQWFERNRLELHPENQRPYDVLLGRLGEDTLIKQGRDWRAEYREPPTPIDHNCEFPSTDGKIFALCSPFRNYYWSHGVEFDGRAGLSSAESLALFGLPLTQARMETNSSGDTVMTQWFERARMEYHPNNPEPYKVLLGLLGNELKGRAQPTPTLKPVVTYITGDGTVYETRGDQPQAIDRVYGRGRVLDAVREGNTIVTLHEGGLMANGIGSEDQTIAEFTRGNARFGNLVAPLNSGLLFYNYARDKSDPNAPFFDGIAGVIEDGTARKLREAPNAMFVLGLTADKRGMMVIDQGGDPSWIGVKIVAVEDGRLLATLPYSGENVPTVSPDGTYVAAATTRTTWADTITFYSTASQTGAPRTATIGHEGWSITSTAWSRDSKTLFVLAYPATDRPTGELWRIDASSRQSTKVASGLPTDTRLFGVQSDGLMLAQTEGAAMLIDLGSGQRTSYSLPANALIARGR
jgi:hypothetical protein